MTYQTSTRPAWAVHENDVVPGRGRVRSVSEFGGAVWIVFQNGSDIVLDANDTVAVTIAVRS